MQQNFSSKISTQEKHARTHARTREREREKMRENIIVTKDNNNKQMTTRERQHIEVAKLEAELNALKVDAFAKVRCVLFFRNSFLSFSFSSSSLSLGVCVLNHDDDDDDDDEISSLSICALSSRFSAAEKARQKPKRVYFCTR
jgi:hypothetical protein